MGFDALIDSLCTRAKITEFSRRRRYCRTFSRKMPQRKVTLPHAATVPGKLFVECGSIWQHRLQDGEGAVSFWGISPSKSCQ